MSLSLSNSLLDKHKAIQPSSSIQTTKSEDNLDLIYTKSAVYHPAQEAYKDLLQDSSENTVVVLGPGSRGLNPFYAFKTIRNAIVIDLFDPFLRYARSIIHSNQPTPIPEIAGGLEEISKDGIVQVDILEPKIIKFRFRLVTSQETERSLIYIRDNYTEESVIKRVIDLAERNKIRAMVHGACSPGNFSMGAALLAQEVKSNRGVIINESIRPKDGISNPKPSPENYEVVAKRILDDFHFVSVDELQTFYGGSSSRLIAYESRACLIVDFQT